LQSPDTVLTALRHTFRNWLFRPKIEHGSIVLTQRRIFILPTRQGFGLALALILMLLGDINYNLSLGYALTFLLATMAVISMLHAFRNLAHLEVNAGRAESVFCGDVAHFELHFKSRIARYQLTLRDAGGHTVSFDLPATENHTVFFPVQTPLRGWLQAGRLTLYTEFPLGLFHAWSYLHFDTRCLIYPKPKTDAAPPQGNVPDGAGQHSVKGDDDFAGLRNYAAGDPLPRIAWKAYARGHALQVKQFATQTGEEVWLNLADTPDIDLEDKLSRMTRWVLDAEEQGVRYSLSLPDGELPAGSGAAHRDACLRRLALFGLTEP
jgi:uncharacterized protein (DUF58 family)